VWAADYEHPLIVRIVPGRLDGEIAAVFPEDDQPSAGRGPLAIAAGLGSIWVLPAEGTRLVQVDPDSGATRSHELPFALSRICAGPDALFGIEPLGDGRVARIDPDGGVTAVPVGRTLRLVAASGDLVWVVDDEPALVLALDRQSLARVAEFRHLGAPSELVASGSRAWYVATPEAEHVDEHGRRERGFVITPEGPGEDLLRFDARTGAQEQLGRRRWVVSPELALDEDRLWISGGREEDEFADDDEDPVSTLHCLDLDGRELLTIERPGQIDALAVGDGTLWVSGFRRSRQADVTTALGQDGTVLGQVSFAPVDLRPWTPPRPPRRPWMSRAARARIIRDEVEADLSQPRQASGRFGDTWEAPPVSDEFRLERVELRGADREPEIAVLFHWAGEDHLFGMKYRIPRRGDCYISVYVEEDLLGSGIEAAVREPADGVTWLRWPQG
jgi:hypothetical protein